MCQVPGTATEPAIKPAIKLQNRDTKCIGLAGYRALCDKKADFPL